LSDDRRISAPSALRNREAILQVLRVQLPAAGRVLEIASGTGEHVAYFAAAMPGLRFHPSDPDPERRASIDSWTDGLENVERAIDLDVTRNWPDLHFNAVICINMIHIAPWESAEALVAGAAKQLLPRGKLVLYGPFKQDGAHTAPSNADFDADLRSRNDAWGIRDMLEVSALAARFGFTLPEKTVMPANNMCLIFRLGT
jgi:cyclopropane fatty-acyl-phospholipid synthase-like methyltransferase